MERAVPFVVEPARKRRPVEPRKRLAAAERRAQIAEAAGGVFLQAGRDGVTIQQVAAAAGVNVALLYRHFASLPALYEAAVVEPLGTLLEQRMEAGLAAAAGRPDDPRDRLAQVHEVLLATLVEAAPMLRVAMLGGHEGSRVFYAERIEPLLRRWIEPAYREVEGARPADCAMLARTVFGIHFSTALYAQLLGVEVDIATTARDVSDFIYLGLVATDG